MKSLLSLSYPPIRTFMQHDCKCRRTNDDDSTAAAPAPSRLKRVSLMNKQPHWNEQRRCWCLNFDGRVKMESIRNFQLAFDSRPDEVVMQVRLHT